MPLAAPGPYQLPRVALPGEVQSLFGCCASCRMAPLEMTKMAQRKSTAKKAAAKSAANRKAAPRKSRTASMLSDLRNDAQALSKRVGRLLERFS